MTDIRSVLITGGTGSFGRSCASFLLRNNMVERLAIFSRGEHIQAAMRAELNDDPRLRMLIGDIRDRDRLRRALQGVDVVIHAAALKRIEVGFYNPIEMCRTNIDGAINVIEAALDAGVKKVVALSTDKAVESVSAYGTSKAMMESLILAANNIAPAGGTRFACTRFGNVWCSAGSVVPKWAAMIKAGAKTVPLTSPDATRYYITMDEAVELVVATCAHMRGAELAIPDLPAYRMGDLAKAFGVKSTIIGLPKFEKLHEKMLPEGSSETARRLSVDFLRDAIEQSVGPMP